MKAPIISFCYNRYDHLQKSLASLLANPEASETDLIVFSDGARGPHDVDDIRRVREKLKKISGFKSVRIVERKINYGVNVNIVDGITRVMDEFGFGIIVEDDIVVSENFLNYMNSALLNYQDEKSVYAISGYSYPFEMSDEAPDVFLLRHPSGWGWATWSDRWADYSHRLEMVDEFSESELSYFNYDDTAPVFEETLRGNVWDIYWNAAICKARGLCLVPKEQLSYTIGLDGSGQMEEVFSNPYLEMPFQACQSWDFPSEIEEHKDALAEIKSYLDAEASGQMEEPTPKRFEELKRKTGLQKIKRETLRALKGVCPPVILRMFGLK